MGRKKGSKNKIKNVPRMVLHKQVKSGDGIKDLQMWKSKKIKRMAKTLPSMSCEIHPELEKITSSIQDPAQKNELQILYARLLKEGKTHEEALRIVQQRKEPGTSSGLQSTSISDMALSSMSLKTSQGNCQCGHIKEMHYGGPKGWCNSTNCLCQEHK